MNSLQFLLVIFVAGSELGSISKSFLSGVKSGVNSALKVNNYNPLPLLGCLKEFGPIDCALAKAQASLADTVTTNYL
jgi:hypothetical protein